VTGLSGFYTQTFQEKRKIPERKKEIKGIQPSLTPPASNALRASSR
jgi:hypothetical protein